MAKLCVALDTTDAKRVRHLIKLLSPLGVIFKLGLEFIYAHGLSGVAHLNIPEGQLFADLKLLDIPNTVVGALKSLICLQPAFLTIHAGDDASHLIAAREFVNTYAPSTRLLAVTVLTSVAGDQSALVKARATHALAGGAHGIVCSPQEVKAARQQHGPHPLLVCPGIRPASAAIQDQKRIATPAAAVASGADILVVGRPILAAEDPLAAAKSILAAMG